jgi:hypothetical protein
LISPAVSILGGNRSSKSLRTEGFRELDSLKQFGRNFMYERHSFEREVPDAIRF